MRLQSSHEFNPTKREFDGKSDQLVADVCPVMSIKQGQDKLNTLLILPPFIQKFQFQTFLSTKTFIFEIFKFNLLSQTCHFSHKK